MLDFLCQIFAPIFSKKLTIAPNRFRNLLKLHEILHAFLKLYLSSTEVQLSVKFPPARCFFHHKCLHLNAGKPSCVIVLIAFVSQCFKFIMLRWPIRSMNNVTLQRLVLLTREHFSVISKNNLILFLKAKNKKIFKTIPD